MRGKRWAALAGAGALVLALGVVFWARPVGAGGTRVPLLADETLGGPPEGLEAVEHLPGGAYSGSEYRDSFTCDPADGGRLGIWFRNNGPDTVVLNVTWNGAQTERAYRAVEVPAGEQAERIFRYEDGGGLDGRWTVEATTRTGARLDLWTAASQYQPEG